MQNTFTMRKIWITHSYWKLYSELNTKHLQNQNVGAQCTQNNVWMCTCHVVWRRHWSQKNIQNALVSQKLYFSLKLVTLLNVSYKSDWYFIQQNFNKVLSLFDSAILCFNGLLNWLSRNFDPHFGSTNRHW